MPKPALLLTLGVSLIASAAAAGVADLSGTWSMKAPDDARSGARRGPAALSLTIDQRAEEITLTVGRNGRMSMTLRTDGTRRQLAVNGSKTPATLAAHWEGADLIVEFTPGRPGISPIRSILRRVDETTVRIEGGIPMAGGRLVTRSIDLTLQPGDSPGRAESGGAR